jgi:hypothetical protein
MVLDKKLKMNPKWQSKEERCEIMDHSNLADSPILHAPNLTMCLFRLNTSINSFIAPVVSTWPRIEEWGQANIHMSSSPSFSSS